MEKLGAYELTEPLKCQNGAYSLWGFGKKDGKEYFIKEFLSPKYPEDDIYADKKQLAQRKAECKEFVAKKQALYQRIGQYSDGNAVPVESFFRIGNRFYATMARIPQLDWSVAQVTALPEETKRFLCGVIAHSVASIHRGQVVHGDLKHENILFQVSSDGGYSAKLIDFDSGFLETDPPKTGEEVVGDQLYFSPEACMTLFGKETVLTCKMDVFALGVLFHRYFAGCLPEFDPAAGSCPGLAAANGAKIQASTLVPEELRPLLEGMLARDPQQRPDAMAVYRAMMSGICGA